VKLDREVNVVAMADGQQLPLPPGSGIVSADGKVRGWVVDGWLGGWVCGWVAGFNQVGGWE
jgi:hypothetical protein